MTDPSVTAVVIDHPNLKEAIRVTIPWDELPPAAREELKRLDRDKSGDLLYCASGYCTEAGKRSEIIPGGLAQDTFSRIFWAWSGGNPYNHLTRDTKTEGHRRKLSREIQASLAEGLKGLRESHDPEVRNDLFGIYVTFAAHEQMLEGADRFLALHEPEGDDRGETFLLEAKRFAGRSSWGRRESFDPIDRALAGISAPLDRFDDERFKWLRKGVDILARPAHPILLWKDDIARKRGFPVLVSVPQGTSREEILPMVKSRRVRIRPSLLGAGKGLQEFELTVIGGIDPLKIDPKSSSVTRFDRLKKVLYREGRDFYYLLFTVAPEAEGSLFDLVMDLAPNATWNIPGSVLIGRSWTVPLRIRFGADHHIEERDYEIQKTEIERCRYYESQTGSDRKLLTGPYDDIQAGRAVNPDDRICDRIARFHKSFNENFERFVASSNEAYAQGGLDYVVLLGDQVNFQNIDNSSEAKAYRKTNFRRLEHIQSKRRFPLIDILGNHPKHPKGYPRGIYKQGFPDDTTLYRYESLLYDAVRFQGPSFWKSEGIKSLITRNYPDALPGSPLQLSPWIIASGEAAADDPYAKPNDEGLGPYYRHIGIHEANARFIGNHHYLYDWDTNEEDFNAKIWAYEGVNEPVGLNLARSAGKYVLNQHVNSKGPRPEVFRHFLKAVEAVREARGQMIVAGHYPPFYLGTGPDQTPDSEDTLRGDVNWALRLATWYYRHENGDPVIDLVVGGHVHRYGEYDFALEFSDEERKAFREKLGAVFADIVAGRVKGLAVYEKFGELRKEFGLDRHLAPRRHVDPKDGFPGPSVREFNGDSTAYGRRHGTLFVNLPALGPTTADSPAGTVDMTISPDGKKKTIMPHYFFLEPDGTVPEGDGTRLPALKERHRKRIGDWMESAGLPPKTPDDKDDFKIPRPEPLYDGPPLFDPGPLICQYPKGKLCLSAGIGAFFTFTYDDFLKTLTLNPVRLTFPLSSTVTYNAWPKNLQVGLERWTRKRTWAVDVALDWGLFGIHFFKDLRFDTANSFFGVGLFYSPESFFSGVTFVMDGTARREGGNGFVEAGVRFGVRLDLTFLSFQPFRKNHKHQAASLALPPFAF